MQDKILSELKKVSEAILNMNDETAITQLHQKAKSLYEKLTVLKYISDSLETTSAAHSEFEDIVAAVEPEETLEDILADIAEPVFEPKVEASPPIEVKPEPIPEPVQEAPPVEVAPEISEVIPEEPMISDYENMFEAVIPEPDVMKNDMEQVTPKTEDIAPAKEEDSKPKSLNDRLNTSINIGLNDKLGFINHLFGGSSEDYNRVISQLNTISTEADAKQFIAQMVKPDYNNWEGKEEYEERLIQIIENRFA